jgi:hypothetical protein
VLLSARADSGAARLFVAALVHCHTPDGAWRGDWLESKRRDVDGSTGTLACHEKGRWVNCGGC